MLFGGFSSILGGLIGVGQVQVRILIAYSSISHWGWIIGMLGVSLRGSTSYFFLYSVISVYLFYFFSCRSSWRVGYVAGVRGFFLVFGLLSLGGLPPLSGFVPKLIGIQVLSRGPFPVLLFFLIIGSILSLYYYLRFLFVSFVHLSRFYVFFSFSKFLRLSVGVSLVVFLLGFPFYEVFFYLIK